MNADKRTVTAGRRYGATVDMCYAYSSICGWPSSGVSCSGCCLSPERVPGLSSRGLRCGSTGVRGRMDGVGGSGLMLSYVPMFTPYSGYSIARISAAKGETL